jgi:phage tail protein X
MKRLLRYFLICIFAFSFPLLITSQSVRTHKVQKKETQYGIAQMYGITVEQLVKANPGMEKPDYKLKKGAIIMIPDVTHSATKPVETSQNQSMDVRHRAIRLGVMLPLHNQNNDGKRMVEYYRGILMACDSLKKEGISIDVHAWNLPENGDVSIILNDPAAAQCDLIIGPLYSRFVTSLSEFAEQHHSLLVIPFSIHAPELYTNRQLFQIYQTPNETNDNTARRCVNWFKDYHPVIIDCADSTSTKGTFTSTYRRQLEINDIQYSLTSLKSSDVSFANAFVKGKPNLVVLNTARSRDLISVFGRLSAIKIANPDIQISMFGYTEWMMYLQYQIENFYKYNVYIPAPFFTNLSSPQTERLEQLYRSSFHQEMMVALPRFALTGFDHALFFLRGLHKYGMTFDGAAGRFGYQPVQTPLKFERIGNGGLQNRAFMFIHYKEDRTIETVNY